MRKNNNREMVVKNSHKNIRGRGIFFIMLIVFISIGIIGMLNLPEKYNAPKTINKIMTSGIEDKEKATQIDQILNQCGIELKDIEHDELLDNATGTNEKGYRISTNDIKNIILYLREDYSIYSIKYADNFLYDDNTVISQITDYYLTNEEKSKLEIQAESTIKSILKSPSTAKFPNILEWKFYKDKEKIVIQSYVDSENSFGATVRNEFQLTLTPDKSNIISLIVDGEEYK